ncbi:UNVERIFIED_CONTAM: hypothetical protein HDU68_002246 [Siphonaria sp. JEL0065]|nr:hypothetical protein HDU68_002246 [Siphonaria sp. JEL0065]
MATNIARHLLGTLTFPVSASLSSESRYEGLFPVTEANTAVKLLGLLANDHDQPLISLVARCIRQQSVKFELDLEHIGTLEEKKLTVRLFALRGQVISLPLLLTDALFPQSKDDESINLNRDLDHSLQLLGKCCPNRDSYPQNVAGHLLQPATMAPTLLPFQKRALSWMLMREGFLEREKRDILFVDKIEEQLAINRFTGSLVFSEDFENLKSDNESDILGGILAGATLIITPSSILSQWISEIKRHAPTVSFYWYKGRFQKDTTSAKELSSKDIVLTSYDVLQKEVYLARADNSRSRRSGRAYERPRSPLIEIKWWRVCLDEAQMVETATSQTSQMARLIPRIHPWAVTGTPISKSGLAGDLKGLCIFLGLEPFMSSHAFKWLLEAKNLGYLVGLFSRVMHRNTKENVKNELVLPKQDQFIVELGFSPVERNYYTDLYQSCMEEIDNLDKAVVGLDSSKRARKIEEAKVRMRQWLLQLRQICCHPQVGEQNKTALGGKIGTIGEVLQVMQRQSVSAVITTERQLIHLRINKAHMNEFLKQYERGIAVYESTLVDIRARIQSTTKELESLKKTMTVNDGDDNEDLESISGTVTATKDSKAELRTILSNQLSGYKELEHQAVFFIACCYNSLKREDLEMKFYEDAETLRREILGDFEKVVNRLRASFFDNPNTSSPVLKAVADLMVWRRRDGEGIRVSGIVVRNGMERTKEMLAMLDSQWDELVVEWRSRILKLINTNLENITPQEEAEADCPQLEPRTATDKGKAPAAQPTGEEYSHGEEVQVELDALLDHYGELLAERRELLTGVLFAKSKPADYIVTEFDKKFIPLRKKYSLKRGSTNFTAILKDLKHSVENNFMPDIERRMASAFVADVNRGLDLQIKTLDELYKELVKIRKLANARIEFFKHLQQISNSVDPPEKPDDVESELDHIQIEINKTETLLASQIGRSKYLENLSSETKTAASTSSSSDYECLVCKCPFDDGFVTECGHFYCDYCMKQWIPKHRRCAMCKHAIHNIELQLTKVEVEKPIMALAAGPSPASTSTSLEQQPQPTSYFQQTMDSITQDRISSLKLDSTDSFGTKTDFILRHILHIVSSDPTAKCLLFSQWDQVLNIVAMGCTKNSIGFVKMEAGGCGKKKRDPVQVFREDPDIKLFMLNARSQSSGLTLVNATHVFLVEPVVNPGLEMQAINRVHRIGQSQETFVYRYIIKDTIEGRIYSLFHRNTGQHTVKGLETKKETKGLGGGEKVVDKDVEWCLFGDKRLHMNDIETRIEEDDDLVDGGLNEDVEDLVGEDVIQFDGSAELDVEVVSESEVANADQPAPRSQFGTGRRGQKRRRTDDGALRIR